MVFSTEAFGDRHGAIGGGEAGAKEKKELPHEKKQNPAFSR